MNVDLDLNVQGYTQGMNQATESTKAYESETRKVADAQVNLMKELKAAKRGAQNLVAGYVQLDEAARNSTFGKEMASQLNEASEKAAYFINLQGDIADGLNTLASETATLDMLTTGFATIGGVASASAGAIALFTGNEKDAQRAVVMFTTAQSVLNTVISAYNGIKKIQNVLLVKGITSTNISTAATNTNTVATRAATIAQKAFNTVAKANPYVLLATTVLAVASAFVIFSDNADEATEAQNKLTAAEENGKKVSETYASTLASEYSKLMASYTKLKAEWASLANDSQRKKFINDHKSELQSLGAEIKNVQDAEGYFNNNTNKVVQAFMKRARAAALAAKAAELYRQEMDIIEKYRNWTETQGHRAGEEAKHVTSITMDPGTKYDKHPTYNNGQYYMDNGVLKYTEKGAEAANKATRAFQELNDAYKQNQRELKNTTDAYVDLMKEMNLLSDTTDSVTNHTDSNTTTTKKEISTYAEAIAEYDRLTQEKEKLNNMLKEGRVDSEFTEEFKKEINAVESQMQSIVDKWHVKAKVEIEPKLDPEKVQKTLDNINKITQDALNPQDLKNQFDFSYLPDELKKAADSMLKDYERIGEARKKLEEIMNNPKTYGADAAAAAKQNLEILNKTWTQLNGTMTTYTDTNKKLKELNEQSEGVKQTMSSLGDITGSLGSAFKAFGADAAAASMQVISATAQMISQVIPQIIKLIAAKEAESLASGMAGASTVPFPGSLAAITTIMTTILSTFATIASVLNGAEKHAGGGIVGGSSFAGDKIATFLNSGEMILNKRQQKNLFDLLDMGAMPNANGVNVQVTGVIRGTDLILVQKNANKIKARTGTSINF